MAVGVLLVGYVTVTNVTFGLEAYRSFNGRETPPLWGIHDVESFRIDGEEVPALVTDSTPAVGGADDATGDGAAAPVDVLGWTRPQPDALVLSGTWPGATGRDSAARARPRCDESGRARLSLDQRDPLQPLSGACSTTPPR